MALDHGAAWRLHTAEARHTTRHWQTARHTARHTAMAQSAAQARGALHGALHDELHGTETWHGTSAAQAPGAAGAALV